MRPCLSVVNLTLIHCWPARAFILCRRVWEKCISCLWLLVLTFPVSKTELAHKNVEWNWQIVKVERVFCGLSLLLLSYPKETAISPQWLSYLSLVHHQLMQLHSLAWTKLPLLCHGLRALQLCPAPAGLALVTVGTPWLWGLKSWMSQ